MDSLMDTNDEAFMGSSRNDTVSSDNPKMVFLSAVVKSNEIGVAGR